MHAIAKGIVFTGLLSALSYGGTARADDFQQGKVISVEAVFARCSATSGVATALCLEKEAGKLKVLLKSRIAEQLKAIAAIAGQPSGPGMLGGPEAAATWRKDFMAAQAAWQAYDDRQCRNVSDYDWYGGSGAGSARLACQIRHLVLRVNELAPP